MITTETKAQQVLKAIARDALTVDEIYEAVDSVTDWVNALVIVGTLVERGEVQQVGNRYKVHEATNE